MVAIYTVWYNFARIDNAVKMSPAMAAGIAPRLWEMSDIVTAIEADAGTPKKRSPDKKRAEA